jgi:hypothetical protein
VYRHGGLVASGRTILPDTHKAINAARATWQAPPLEDMESG